jgi:hypothetical protein
MTTKARSSTVEHRIGPDGVLALRLDDGDIRIRGVAGDRASVRASGGDRLDDLVIQRGDGSLTIAAGRGPDGRHGRAASGTPDLIVEMPAAATLLLDSRNGDIRTEGLTGQARLTSASGDVVVREAGGSLTIEAVSGDIEIDAPGTVELVTRTVSGDLEVHAGVLRRLQAGTTSGDISIDATFRGDGPFSIEAVSGDTSLASNGPARVEARTLTGDLTGPGPGHPSPSGDGSIVLGATTGPTVIFRSTSGDLSLTIADGSGAGRTEPDLSADARLPEVSSLDVLQALERGEIDVSEAADRLDALEREVPADA